MGSQKWQLTSSYAHQRCVYSAKIKLKTNIVKSAGGSASCVALGIERKTVLLRLSRVGGRDWAGAILREWFRQQRPKNNS